MQTVYCDVCRKKMDNPITNRSFYYFAEYGLCEPCKDNLEVQLKSQARTKDPFAFNWYDKLIQDTISKGIQKGKI